MAFDLAAIDDILKDMYEGPTREQLNHARVFLAWVRKNPEREYHGRKAYIPLHTGRNVGVGARLEDVGGSGVDELPAAGNQQYDHAEYTCKYNYGRIKITGPAMKATRSDIGAFVRALDSEMRGIEEDVPVDVNRQVLGDGSSILTDCGASGPSTSVTVSSTARLTPGMRIDIRTRADGTLITNGSGTVVSITSATVFVFSASVTVTTAESIIRQNTRNAAAWGTPSEMQGIQALVSDANPGNGLNAPIGAISRTGNVFWDSNVLTNSGTLRDLTLELMQEAEDRSDIAAGVKEGLILTNHAMNRRYAALLQPDKRYPAGGDITLDGGYKALEFNGIPLVKDKDFAKVNNPSSLNGMYFLAKDNIELTVLADWSWMDEDGAILSRVSGRDSYEATFYAYMELTIDRGNSHTFLGDLRETA